MYDKYEVRTYPEYIPLEDSDIETDIKPSIISNRNAKDQNECIFTNEDRNLSFYYSDSKSSFKERKYRSLNQKKNMNTRKNELDIIRRKNTSFHPNYIPVREHFSYNYSNDNGNTKENKDINRNNIKFANNNKREEITQHILLGNYIKNSSHQVPKRTIKSYQNEFDIEKSDNFNVLSYKPLEYNYESDIVLYEKKSKMIQTFKKEETEELFFPPSRSKMENSPKSPSSSHNSSFSAGKKGNKKLFSYQSPTFKFQRFFGSYTREKNNKNGNMAKSTSKKITS